jgi:hypothetical protein
MVRAVTRAPQQRDISLNQFSCVYCASPAIVVPLRIEDGSGIHCRRCSGKLGTWAELKERARQATSAAGLVGRISADPLGVNPLFVSVR